MSIPFCFIFSEPRACNFFERINVAILNNYMDCYSKREYKLFSFQTLIAIFIYKYIAKNIKRFYFSIKCCKFHLCRFKLINERTGLCHTNQSIIFFPFESVKSNWLKGESTIYIMYVYTY